MSGRKVVPPPGYIRTTDAAELLGISHSYVRRLAQNRTLGVEPSLDSQVLRSEGGREYRYVLRIEVEQLRNSGAVRSRRNTPLALGGGADPHATTGTAISSGPAPDEVVSPAITRSESVAASATPAGTAQEEDWELRLELAASNARSAGLEAQVDTLQRLVETLQEQNTQLRRRLALLGRLQMQLVEGYADTTESDQI